MSKNNPDLIVGTDNGLLSALSFKVNSYYNVNPDVIPSSDLSVKSLKLTKDHLDKNKLLVCSHSGLISIYHLDSFPYNCETIDTQSNAYVNHYSTDMINIDNNKVVINFKNGVAQIWNLETKKKIIQYEIANNLTFVKKSTLEENLYIFGSRGLMPKVISINDHEYCVVYKPKTLSSNNGIHQWCTSSEFSLDSKDLFICGFSAGAIACFDKRTNIAAASYNLSNSGNSINCLNISKTNKVIASDSNGSLFTFDFRMMKDFICVNNNSSSITSIKSTNNNFVLTSSLDKQLRVYEAVNLNIVYQTNLYNRLNCILIYSNDIENNIIESLNPTE